MKPPCPRDDLDRLVLGPLSASAEARLRAHVEECEACRKEHGWLVAERRAVALRGTRPADLPSFDAMFAKANERPAGTWAGFWSGARALWRQTVAAQVVVALATSVLVFTAATREKTVATPLIETGPTAGATAGARPMGPLRTSMSRDAACVAEEGPHVGNEDCGEVALGCLETTDPALATNDCAATVEPLASVQAVAFEEPQICSADPACAPEPL